MHRTSISRTINWHFSYITATDQFEWIEFRCESEVSARDGKKQGYKKRLVKDPNQISILNLDLENITPLIGKRVL